MYPEPQIIVHKQSLLSDRIVHPLVAAVAADVHQDEGLALGGQLGLKVYCLIPQADGTCDIGCPAEGWVLGSRR